jgi:branched-chain amino acid transport system substrate-binding protein
MKRSLNVISLLVLLSLVLAACAPAATEAPATEAPATEAPATEAPTEAPAMYECTDALGCVTIAPGDPIHFAWINSVSGPTAALGQTNVNGGQLAIDDRGGELLGHPIQYDGEGCRYQDRRRSDCCRRPRHHLLQRSTRSIPPHFCGRHGHDVSLEYQP